MTETRAARSIGRAAFEILGPIGEVSLALNSPVLTQQALSLVQQPEIAHAEQRPVSTNTDVFNGHFQIRRIICPEVKLNIVDQLVIDRGGRLGNDSKPIYTDPKYDSTSRDEIIRPAAQKTGRIINPSSGKAQNFQTNDLGRASVVFNNIETDGFRNDASGKTVPAVDLRVVEQSTAGPVTGDPRNYPCGGPWDLQIWHPISEQEAANMEKLIVATALPLVVPRVTIPEARPTEAIIESPSRTITPIPTRAPATETMRATVTLAPTGTPITADALEKLQTQVAELRREALVGPTRAVATAITQEKIIAEREDTFWRAVDKHRWEFAIFLIVFTLGIAALGAGVQAIRNAMAHSGGGHGHP